MIGRCSRVHRLTSGNAPAAGDGGGYDDDASSQASVEGDDILSGRMHRSFRSQMRAMLLQQPIATTRQDDM